MFLFSRLLMFLIRMNNLVIYGGAVLLILITSWWAYWLEPETFGSPFNGLWWVTTTVFTVGYGDFAPKTVGGKCLGMFLFAFGIGLISLTISKFVDGLLVYQRRKEEGKLRYAGKDHIVIVDWSRHAELAIREIFSIDPTVEVVLIDTLEKTPIKDPRVHFIQGNPVDPNTLELASLSSAKAVFIFADEITQYRSVVRDFSFIDGKTLLIATAIERAYSHVHTVVEVMDERNLPSFKHVKVDEFILGQDTISRLAVRSAFTPGTSSILSRLLRRGDGGDLFEIPKHARWETYRDAFEELLQKGATLISDGSDLDINKRLDERISDEARLFVICDQETYERLDR